MANGYCDLVMAMIVRRAIEGRGVVYIDRLWEELWWVEYV
jgi:hypothetical protein